MIVFFNSKLEFIFIVFDFIDFDGVCYRVMVSSFCIDYMIVDIDNEMKLCWGKLVIYDIYGLEIVLLL